MKLMRWCFPGQKTKFQHHILNVPLGMSHMGVWALIYALHLRCEIFLSVWQGNIVSHYIWKNLTVFRKSLSKNRLYILGRNPF